MRTRIVVPLAAATAVALLLCPARAAAQQQFDTNPPPPNVLILLDNSGSMERMIDGTIPESDPASTCNCDPVSGDCGGYKYNPKPNRWNTVQTALTGDLTNGFNCVAMPRTPGSKFTDEYQIGGKNPYDTNYYLAFHRMVAKYTNKAGTTIPCVVAPGVLPGTIAPNGVSVQGFGGGAGTLATDFNGAIINRKYPYSALSTSTGGECTFEQLQNGAIGTMTNLMRFGLMTFDQDPNAGTGVNPDGTVATSTACDGSGNCGAFAGMWSYFPTWNTSSPMCPYQGNPVNCTTPIPWAVGARNPAAPAWEGRMVGFPTPTGDPVVNNNNVASVILASRPYGATPLAGMFTQAQYYFQTDPSGPGASGGGDPLVQGGCRPEYIILLTDGAPNYDMRPDCTLQSGSDAGTPGVCPFNLLPEQVAGVLYNNGQRASGQQFVKTYVIGFAVSSYQDMGTTAQCSTLVSNGQLTAAGALKCASLDPATQAAVGPCCELERIAVAGGTNQAYFAQSPGDLQKALGAILADIAKNATTRTTPAFSGVYTNAVANTSTPQTNAAAFLASFNPSPGQPWSGDVVRQRYDCTLSSGTFAVPAQTIDSSQGDDFAANLNSSSAAGNRVFIAMQPDPVSAGSTIDSTVTIRPFVASTVADGLGKYGATAFSGLANAVVPNITPDALSIPITGATTGCPYTPNNAPGTKYLGAADNGASCRNMLLDFTFGQPFTGPTDFTFVSRAANAFGDVFHATPAVVGPPAGLLQDPSYVGFRATWAALTSTSAKPREQIAYVATNDGLLHAFWADETKLENNERWAMLLPAAMPSVLSTYPSGHHFLLDGSPIVKDVVWQRSTVSSALPSPWHTMLVAGFGPYARGYYAVDVTNPDPSGLPSASTATSSPPYASVTFTPLGPVFRWQLTKMPSTNYKIFGDQSGTPAITTLFMDPGDTLGPREIGVAILPGGVDQGGPTSSASSGPSCQRQSSIQKRTGAQPLDTNFAYRDSVRCWGPSQKQGDIVNGRSLSIVRIDTGEILRVFARLGDVPAGDTLRMASPTRIIDTPLDSPMTGTPIVYPADVGGIATKVFAGDADGTIWRFDLSSTDPSKWRGQIFLDLYNNTADKAPTTNWADGQPFDVVPVLSTTSTGEVVLNVASGAIETFDSNGKYYIYSITEKVQGTASTANDSDDPTPTGPKLRAFVNWWLGPSSTPVALRAGERVSGPMTVFDKVLYFATYFAGDPKALSCTNGSARLWGFDYVTPLDTTNCPADSTTCGQGGARRFPPTAPTDFVDPTAAAYGVAQAAVIPGVSIRASPACASLGSSTSSYVGGTHVSTSNFSSGTYSLFATVGASGGNRAGPPLDIQLPTPASPTLIDSWAAVLE